MKIKEEADRIKIYGTKQDNKYEELKSNIFYNKIKTHEYQENSKSIFFFVTLWVEKIIEIKRNNKHLLDKLLIISKGKNCTTN
jgi:hypothetical protein